MRKTVENGFERKTVHWNNNIILQYKNVTSWVELQKAKKENRSYEWVVRSIELLSSRANDWLRKIKKTSKIATFCNKQMLKHYSVRQNNITLPKQFVHLVRSNFQRTMQDTNRFNGLLDLAFGWKICPQSVFCSCQTYVDFVFLLNCLSIPSLLCVFLFVCIFQTKIRRSKEWRWLILNPLL